MGTCTIKHRMYLTPSLSNPCDSLPVLQQSLLKCSIIKKKTTHISIKWMSYLLVLFRQDTSCILFGGLNLSSNSSFLRHFFFKISIPLFLVCDVPSEMQLQLPHVPLHMVNRQLSLVQHK